MAKPLASLDQQGQRQLVMLAGAIARQIVRRELKPHPDEIVGGIWQTVVVLPLTAREVRVNLNPEEAKLVPSRLAEASGDRAWSIAEDPIISRGGCRVSSESSSIDAQLEQRIGAAIGAGLGAPRAAPAPDEASGAQPKPPSIRCTNRPRNAGRRGSS